MEDLHECQQHRKMARKRRDNVQAMSAFASERASGRVDGRPIYKRKDETEST